MRTIPSEALTLLASQEAIEPINIVAIEWSAGHPIYYCDKAIPEATGKILDMGDIDDMQRSDSSGTTSAVTVKLDDIDGSLKSIFNKVDIHLVKVNVYQTFASLGFASKFLVLSGQISTPLVWNEGDQTLSFDIVSKLEDQEVGWSAEMGNFNLVAQELLGQSWPMIFGTVQHSPGLQLQNVPTAFTTEPFGIADSTLDTELANLQNLYDEAVLATLYYSQLAASEQREIQDDSDVQTYQQMQADIQNRMNELRQIQTGMAAFVRGSVGLIPTVNVTAPYSGTVRVGNNLFHATITNLSGTLTCVPLMQPGQFAATNVKVGQQFYDAGTQVVIAGPYPIEFVASIIPGTVLRVWAEKSFNGIKKLSVVPPSYYTVSTKNYGGQSAVIVTLKQPLSGIAFNQDLYTQNWENNFGQYLPPHIVNHIDWDDQIYITFQSSIGPNPVDIMEYLINTYTHNTFDVTSFDHVKSLLTKFPMNFMLNSQQNVMELLTELAYQARCVIFLRDDVFYLIFLPEVPTPVDTLTESDIIDKSLTVSCSSTENLITKYVATYRPDYSPQFNKPVRIILRYNINKYGMHEESHDFYAYNTFYPTEKVATFWMIRRANTFKILKAKLFITKLNLEVFDAVTLDFNKNYVADVDVVGIITSCRYNSNDRTIDVEIWCPVRLGEMLPYTFAWPAGLTEQDIFPTTHDIESGSAGGTNGGQQLPQNNPVRNPVGIIDLIDFQNGADGGLNGRLNWTSGSGLMGDEFTPLGLPDPTEQMERYTPTPVGGTSSDYIYNTTFDPSIVQKKDNIPVRVLEFVSVSPTNSNLMNYRCESYENGLSKPPTITIYGQLQINPNARLPPNTWTHGCITQTKHKASNGDVSYTTSKTIQVPIWLR